MTVCLVTSVPPRLKRKAPDGQDFGPAYQRRCVASWLAEGWDVVSVNPAAECETVREAHPGLRVEAVDGSASAAFGKPCVWIEDMLSLRYFTVTGLEPPRARRFRR